MSKLSRRQYKISIEDESHLTELATLRLSGVALWLSGAGVLLASLLIGALLVTLTPIRTLLPGYLKQSQRSATEEGLMRLDSLMEAYDVTQAYIDNFVRVTDTDRQPSDSAAVTPVSRDLSSDSLSGPTPLEQRFVTQMEQRERFNISVLAPLAADGVMFSPMAPDGIFTADTRDTDAPVLVLPSETSIQAPADGTVVALHHSSRNGGYVIVVQHPRGFVTSLSGTGTPLVSVGDNVYSGQVIALSPTPDSKGTRRISVRMWHNGLALKPYEYLGQPSRRQGTAGQNFEAPRGR